MKKYFGILLMTTLLGMVSACSTGSLNDDNASIVAQAPEFKIPFIPENQPEAAPPPPAVDPLADAHRAYAEFLLTRGQASAVFNQVPDEAAIEARAGQIQQAFTRQFPEGKLPATLGLNELDQFLDFVRDSDSQLGASVLKLNQKIVDIEGGIFSESQAQRQSAGVVLLDPSDNLNDLAARISELSELTAFQRKRIATAAEIYQVAIGDPTNGDIESASNLNRFVTEVMDKINPAKVSSLTPVAGGGRLQPGRSLTPPILVTSERDAVIEAIKADLTGIHQNIVFRGPAGGSFQNDFSYTNFIVRLTLGGGSAAEFYGATSLEDLHLVL